MNERVNVIPIFLGDSGIGKTSICRRIAEDVGVKYYRWDPDAQLFDDNLGIPDPNGKVITNPDGTTKKVTANMEAELLPIFEQEALLLEISELPTARKSVLNQVRQIIDGKFNSRDVSPNCMLIATGNPLTTDYTTVEADLCHSIEERLHPYIVVPDKAELYAIWSIIMKPTIYQFLINHEQFFEMLTPRGWMEIAVSTEALIQAGVDAAYIIADLRTKLPDTLTGPLLNFLQSGYQPDKVPILGRDLLGSNEEQFEAQLDRIKRWFSKGQQARGFVGATQLDLARVLTQSDNTFATRYQDAGQRFTRFAEVLVANNAQDIGSSLIDALYRSSPAVRSTILATLRESDVMTKMGEKYVEFLKKYEHMLQ